MSLSGNHHKQKTIFCSWEVQRLSKRNAVPRQKILLISSLPAHLLSRGGVPPDVIHNSRALADFPHAFNALAELAKQGY